MCCRMAKMKLSKDELAVNLSGSLQELSSHVTN